MRKKLIQARKDRGLTQEKAAEELGIKRVHYAFLEIGKRNPSNELAVRIYKKWGVPLEELLLVDQADENE